MKISDFLFVLCLMGAFSVCCAAQIALKKKSELSVINNSTAQTYKSTPAFAEIILRKTELESELESLLVSYTEEFPKVKEIRYESGLLKKEIERLSAVKSAESSKLTLALGKLMIRKVELETEN